LRLLDEVRKGKDCHTASNHLNPSRPPSVNRSTRENRNSLRPPVRTSKEAKFYESSSAIAAALSTIFGVARPIAKPQGRAYRFVAVG